MFYPSERIACNTAFQSISVDLRGLQSRFAMIGKVLVPRVGYAEHQSVSI